MAKVKKRFIYAGILLCVVGALPEGLVVGAFGSLGMDSSSGREVLLWAVDFMISVMRFGLAPLGAVLLAFGIALHWLRDFFPQFSDPSQAMTGGSSPHDEP
ncbi:hypothetical protein SPF06_15215 [Sinomonas sp. JGH33]|uniref:Uncharacterized protein n=1 Tax=Sinomonas terricola TaxID=3110330 RepID=A0ABU5T928_9MICC|nr:hypothetical protein [Sinomonas sp. JGH33]MEA5456083.1 hypothetical protein [Sinomonas sp. JGH33]